MNIAKVIVCLLSFLCLGAADQNATSDTEAVRVYLQNLKQKSDCNVLSGQFIGWLGKEDPNIFQQIYKISGKYPAIMSANYADFGVDIFEFNSTNALLIDHWRHGGLVEVGIHFDNPINNKWDRTSNVDMIKLIKPGEDLNTNFNIQLDRISVGLEELQAAGVVVLFRPFMEANGDWFWWGRKNQIEFIDLWKYTFDYLTKYHNLHNLLWVYSISAGYGDALTYYPGDNYVDIVGLDYYSANGKFQSTEEYRQLLATKKLIALTELGQCRSSGFGCSPKDTMDILSSIRTNMSAIIYWSNWNDEWALSNHFNLRGLMNNECVINRGDIKHE